MARNRQKAKQRKAKREKQQLPPRVVDQAVASGESDLAQAAVVAKSAPEAKEAPPPKAAPAPKARVAANQSRERGKVVTFFKEVRAELKKVEWPDRQALSQGTAVVVGAVFLAGLYLGVWDFIWSKLVEAAL